MGYRLTWCATRLSEYQGYSLRKSSLKEQTANATCGPLQCILHWEIVRKVKRASFPCVAFFPCRLTFRTISQCKIHWRGTACCVFCLCFQRRRSRSITLITAKRESSTRSGWSVTRTRAAQPGRIRIFFIILKYYVINKRSQHHISWGPCSRKNSNFTAI